MKLDEAEWADVSPVEPYISRPTLQTVWQFPLNILYHDIVGSRVFFGTNGVNLGDWSIRKLPDEYE